MHVSVLLATEVFEADSASSADGIVILSQDVPDALVHVINDAAVISILNPLLDQLPYLLPHAALDLLDLIIVQTLDRCELNLRRLQWILCAQI